MSIIGDPITLGGGGDPNARKMALPSGDLSYRWSYGIFDEKDDFSVDVSEVSRIDYLGARISAPLSKSFYNARRLRSITLLNYYSNGTFDMTSFAQKDGSYGSYSNNLESITITTKNLDYLKPSASVSAFGGLNKLKYINVVFSLEGISFYEYGYNFRSMFSGCTALEEVRFVPNSILWMNTSYQIFNVSQNFSDDSLVSIANALRTGSTVPNLKLLSTPYSRCSTLMGTVSDGLFTQDDQSGTVSLADFITNTKGWTLYT